MEHFIVYKTTNTINNKIYIGQHYTENINDNYIGSGLILLKSIKKYGKDNFIKEIIEECDSFDDMNEKETFWINHFNSFVPNGYNIREGGRNSPMSESTKKILSDARKGKYKMGEDNPNYKAKSFTKETIDKIRNSVIERYKNDPTYKEKISSTSKNRKRSDESLKKQSDLSIGINNPNYLFIDDECKNNIINMHTKENYSRNKIGKLLNIAPQTINRILMDNGITIIKHTNQHN